MSEQKKHFMYNLHKPVLGFLVGVALMFVLTGGYNFFRSNYPANWIGNKVTEIVSPVPLVDQDNDPLTPNIYTQGEDVVGVFTVTRYKTVEADLVIRTWCSNGYRDESFLSIPRTKNSVVEQPIVLPNAIKDGMQGACYLTYDSLQKYQFLGVDRTLEIQYRTEIFNVEE